MDVQLLGADEARVTYPDGSSEVLYWMGWERLTEEESLANFQKTAQRRWEEKGEQGNGKMPNLRQ